MIEGDLLKQANLLNSSRFPTNQLVHVSKKDIRYIKSNLNVIKNYLNYTKIYISQYRKINDEIQLQILHDSNTPSYLESILTCSDETIEVDPPLELNVPSYSLKDNYININSSINFDTKIDCIESIEVTKGSKKEKISNQHIYFNQAAEISFIDQSGLSQFGDGLTKYSSEDQEILFILSEGDYVLSENVIFPAQSSVTFNPGVNIFLHPNISILIKGSFVANGKDYKKISIKRYKSDPFGTFAVLGNSSFKPEVDLNYFELSGGSEAILNGVYFSSQMSIHHGNVNINFSKFEESFSDDGLNIKFSPVIIKNSIFQNNTADQIDLDYSDGEVVNNIFNFTKQNSQDFITDGLDISGSKVLIVNNSFKNMTDKGISIGEQANVILFNNKIFRNNNGIAVKDGSKMCFVSNEIFNNKIDINSYIKKKMYQLPSLFVDTTKDLKLNITNFDDTLSSDIPAECKDKIDSIKVKI
jgi:parallel beta-helix repeat protein